METAADVSHGSYRVEVENQRLETFELPDTGGAGAAPIIIGGLSLMILPLCINVYLRKRRQWDFNAIKWTNP